MNLITEKYQKLNEYVKDPENRARFKLEDFVGIKHDLESLNTEETNTWLNFIYTCLRYLRNVCVCSKQNQNHILESGILDLFVSLLSDKLLSPDFHSAVQSEELLLKTKLVSAQFLGNLIVQNERTKEAVWTRCFPTLFLKVRLLEIIELFWEAFKVHSIATQEYRLSYKILIEAQLPYKIKMMSCFDNKCKDCLCMVLYNCLRERTDFLTCDDDFWIALSVIDFTKDSSDTEWGLLIMELFICSQYFSMLYKSLDTYSTQRCVVLDILNGYLTEMTENDQIYIPEENILLLAEVFETKLTCVLMLAKEVSDELIEESTQIVKLLSILCSSTACHQKYINVRRRESLLKSAVRLLDALVKTVINKKLDNEPPLNVGVDNSKHHFVGLQRDIIRLIGNMCYANDTMQDLVRECNGIAPILNSCNIVESNPYIMQWSIFTIRNLCEGNIKNQEFVRNFKMKGIAENKILTDSNIRTTLVNGKITMTSSDQEKMM